MRKLYNFTSLSLSLITVGLVLVGTTSCIDDTYSIDKEIDMEMNVGGALTLPVGSTKPIVLGDMLDPEKIEMLKVENGEYKIAIEDAIEIEIDKIAGENEIALDAYSVSEVISMDFDKPSIDPIDLDIPSSSIDITPAISEVSLGSGDDISSQILISPNIGNFPTIPDIDIPYTSEFFSYDGHIPVTLDKTSISFNFGGGMICPEGVDAITNIAIGSTVTILVDVSVLADRFKDNFSLTIPSLKVTFPEGFVLDDDNNLADGNDNIVERADLTSVGDKVELSFKIKEYNKRITPNSDGTIPNIGGDIVCAVSDYFVVEGTTSGNTSSEDDIVLDIDSTIQVSDMDLEISGIEIEVPGLASDELCGDPISIALPSLVKEITSVTLDNASNKLNIAISPIGAPAGLSADEAISLRFPVDKFVLATDADVVESADFYTLNIPVSAILGSTPYNKTISIEQILFSSSTLTEGDGESTLSFSPDIELVGETISLGGDISMSELNDFISKTTKVETSVSGSALVVESADIVINDFIATPEAQVYDIAQEVDDIPAELKRIDRVEFHTDAANDGVYVDINLEVEINGTDAALSFENYKISFPEFIKFAASDDISSDNTLTFVDDIFEPDAIDPSKRVFKRRYEIEYLDFTGEKYEDLITSDGKLKIDEQVSMEGGIKLASGGVDISELDDKIEATAEVSISKMAIGRVYGKVEPELPESEPTVFELGDITEEFTDGELSAVLANPTVTIEAVNSLAIPVEIYELEIKPTKGGEPTVNNEGEPIHLSLSEPIEIAAATESEDASTTIIITTKQPVSADADTEYVVLEDLKYLLCDLPEKIEITYGARVTGEEHMIDLYKDYKFSINYAVDVPLAFDEFTLEYSTSFDGLSESLADFAEMINSVELELIADNTLPIEVSIDSITPLDVDGNEIKSLPAMIDPETSTIKANGEPSIVKLTLSNNEARDLTKLDGLDIAVSAAIDSSVGGALKEDQSLSFKIVARIPDGVHIDGDTIMGDNTEE